MGCVDHAQLIIGVPLTPEVGKALGLPVKGYVDPYDSKGQPLKLQSDVVSIVVTGEAEDVEHFVGVELYDGGQYGGTELSQPYLDGNGNRQPYKHGEPDGSFTYEELREVMARVGCELRRLGLDIEPAVKLYLRAS